MGIKTFVAQEVLCGGAGAAAGIIVGPEWAGWGLVIGLTLPLVGRIIANIGREDLEQKLARIERESRARETSVVKAAGPITTTSTPPAPGAFQDYING